MSRWSKVPLGEVLALSNEVEMLMPSKIYRMAGISSYCRGLFYRGDLSGADTKYEFFHRLHRNQIILSQLKGWEGAIALSRLDFEGSYLPPHNACFSTRSKDVDIDYVFKALSRPEIWNALKKNSRGMGARRETVSIRTFLDLAIPLPPLDEQRRIVARLEEVSARTEKIKLKYSGNTGQIWHLCRKIIRSAKDRGGSIEFASELMSRRALDVTVEPEITYDFAGVYSFGRGVFPSDSKRGADFSYTQLTQLRVGDFVYPKLMAWEGALGVVPPECDGRVVSPEFPVFEIDRGRISPAIVDVFFRDPETWQTLRDGSKGTNLRRRRINPDQFLMLKVPVPSKADRLLLDELIPKAKKATDLVAEASSELDQLLPSLLHQAFG